MVVGMEAIKLHHNLNHFDLKVGRFPDTGSYESWVALYHKVRYSCLYPQGLPLLNLRSSSLSFRYKLQHNKMGLRPGDRSSSFQSGSRY